MTPRFLRRAALAGLPILFVAHNDFWLWGDQTIILGVPAGLLYHIGYCVAAAFAMLLLVRHAWPTHLEIDGEPREIPSPKKTSGTTR